MSLLITWRNAQKMTAGTSAKLDFRRNRIWTIPHIWGAKCLHSLNFVKIFWSGAEICPQNKIRNKPSSSRILLPVPILTNVIFRGLSCVWSYKNLRKPLNGRLSYMRFNFFCTYSFKPTLSTARRHSAVMRAIYTGRPTGKVATRTHM